MTRTPFPGLVDASAMRTLLLLLFAMTLATPVAVAYEPPGGVDLGGGCYVTYSSRPSVAADVSGCLDAGAIPPICEPHCL